MKITLKELSLRNFKGIKELTLSNLGNEVNVKGENATGKSTINDAFRYLLFGKNSDDKTDFNIKTLKPDGTPIHNLEHEVVGVLDIDGVQTTLKKILKEKWVKQRGQTEIVMVGHETVNFYNDVPLSQREYMSKINAICPETHFKLLTDPSYFPSLAWTKQRELLFGLAGTITDLDVAQGNPVFIALLKYLQDTKISLAEYKKELAAKRTKIKTELDAIPTRIDELFKSLPEAKDWDSIQREIDDREAAIRVIDNFISGKITEQSETFKASQGIEKKRNEKIERRDHIAFDVKTAADKAVNNAKSSLDTINFNISTANNAKNRLITENIIKKADIKKDNATLETLREEWRKINNEALTFNEADFCCSECKRAYVGDDYERIEATMIANFNQSKVKKLQENETKGKKLSDTIKSIRAEIDDNLVKITLYEEKNTTMQAEKTKAEEAIPAGQPDITKLLDENEEYKNLCLQIQAIEVPQTRTPNDFTDRQASKDAYRKEIDAYKKTLNDKDTIEKTNARIEELKVKQTKLAQEQATIEKGEFEITNFEKAKIETIESRVNGLFKIVKFKMFDQQLNGGEVPTCVCTVNGVPYPDLNNAMRINAGLDIITTLSRADNVYAPVFIDNRESVNTLVECQSQIINLIVTNDKQLIVN